MPAANDEPTPARDDNPTRPGGGNRIPLPFEKPIFELEQQLSKLEAQPKPPASTVEAIRNMRLEIARCYAQCARHTPAGQAEKSQRFLVKAVETLRKSVDNGFKDYVYVESEPDLDPLRARGDFKALLAKITPAK